MVGVLKNRERAREMDTGSSLADVDPMAIDTKVRKTFFIVFLFLLIIMLFICFLIYNAVLSQISFEDVGGLDHHIRALKEMVVFPLLYPEVFEKFSISPPRGVLFYGPPGMKSWIVILFLIQ